MSITTNTEPDGDLKVAARVLLDAARAYFAAYTNAGLRGAVVWVEDTDGRLVLLTRGEYRDELMRGVHRLSGENIHRWGQG